MVAATPRPPAAGDVLWRPGLQRPGALTRGWPPPAGITNGRVVAVSGGATVELPAGVVGQAGLDRTTVAGPAANGDAAYVSRGAPGSGTTSGCRATSPASCRPADGHKVGT